MDAERRLVMLKLESITVRRRFWHTVHDARKGRPDRVRHDVVIVLSDGTQLSSTRISRAKAQRLIAAGARFDTVTEPSTPPVKGG